MSLKIVGWVSSEDEADELQGIAKVIVVERRIKEISRLSRIQADRNFSTSSLIANIPFLGKLETNLLIF